jgi:hypothetical protein
VIEEDADLSIEQTHQEPTAENAPHRLICLGGPVVALR